MGDGGDLGFRQCSRYVLLTVECRAMAGLDLYMGGRLAQHDEQGAEVSYACSNQPTSEKGKVRNVKTYSSAHIRDKSCKICSTFMTSILNITSHTQLNYSAHDHTGHHGSRRRSARGILPQ